ncbi:MAG: outer membrane lipid asymmetry maintenance protein MlaD [Alphaproteobacteria bacterium]|nr:outer membrane lipid asymmetry maintenance protein MlaD [Alphaproteobacteria bacterium]MBU0796527.1 outer membrane lipid asymmetry maintenance protein MlaD [Alphaproteobacteria bacterium]MBU0888059.1 outer membrane lipid asymmetry maintenance protein MlaD [Alphaproteobacteria bacterium]MBU1811504.1 outer membrane lipid asymmetry maintenance protein MlaD [Alphaproteobacteria bacterium]MBU2091588.1 outer membrane lipid asymmetry maintenance protein MlaD [Alphaproteobacteria bacterium]
MNRSLIETVMGGVVLVVAGMFLVFAFSAADLRAVSGYTVTANFDQASGVNTGGDVRISGIKVGSIIGQRLNPDTYLAEVSLSIDPSIKLPRDTIAKVASEGLLGGAHMQLIPGGEDEMIPPGGRIMYTQSSVDIIDLLGRFVFSAASSTQGQGQGEAAPAPAEAPKGPLSQ